MSEDHKNVDHKTAETEIDTLEDEKRLDQLRQFAEEKKYVRQGEDGTLPSIYGGMGILAMKLGANVRYPNAEGASTSANESATANSTANGIAHNPAEQPPPEDEQGLIDGQWRQQRRRSSGLKGWLQKQKEKAQGGHSN